MYTVFSTYVQYYFTEFNIIQKPKYTNKVGVTSWQLFGQNKILIVIWPYLHILFIFGTKIPT